MANDPWADFRKKPASAPPPVQPTQVPPYRLPSSPAKVQQLEKQVEDAKRADTRIGIDVAQEGRQQQAHQYDVKSIEANGGVVTKEGQDTAAFHVVNLERNLQALQATAKANPDSVQPGTLETVAGWVTDDPTVLGYARKFGGGGERQIAASAAEGALESSVYLFTGAAAQEDQVKRMRGLIVPNQSDDEKTLLWKKSNMQTQIEAARAKAGPADVKAQAALDRLEGSLDYIYSPEKVKSTTEADPFYDAEGRPLRNITDIVADPKGEAADEYDTIEYKPEAQQAHFDWIKSNPTATAQDYINFRMELDKKYLTPEEFGGKYAEGGYDPEQAEAFLQWVRRSPHAQIPPIYWRRKLSGFEQMINNASETDTGVGVVNAANAASFGVGELFAGDKAKRIQQRRNNNSWKSALVGDVLGSAVPVGAGGKLIGKMLPSGMEAEAAAKAAGLISNTGYGAVRGFNAAPEGEGLKGAALGGGLAAVGAKVGNRLGAGSRGGNSPRMRENLDLTIDNKDMTLLQRMGKGDFEEGLQGVPLVRSARVRSIKGMNLDKANRALKAADEAPLKGTPESATEINKQVDGILSAKYNQLRPKIKGNFDPQFKTATDAMAKEILTSGDSLKVDLFREIQGAGKKFSKGFYDGMTFKDADQKLRQLAHDWSQVEAGPGITNPSVYHDMARLADKFRVQLRAQVGRNDPAVGAALKKLDKGWALKLQAEDATSRAKGFYSADQLLTSIKKLDRSKNKGKFARGQALDQRHAEAVEELLGKASPQEHANLMQTSGITYLATKHPLTVGVPLGLMASLSYTPGVKQLAKALITGKRNPKIPKAAQLALAQALRKNYTENREED